MTTRGNTGEETSIELRDSVHDLPPSAKLVALVLEHNGTLTQREITTESLLPERTVRFGLKELQQVDIVESKILISDPRKRLYSLSLESTAESN